MSAAGQGRAGEAAAECHGVREYALGADAVPWPR